MGVAVLMGAALLQILLVPRWQAEWLVYLAQTTMLAAYVRFTVAFPHADRHRRGDPDLLWAISIWVSPKSSSGSISKIYVRPTRYFSLVLPVLPLLQLIGIGGIDEVSLFYLLAAATFYGVACGQLRWKSLGYAAGVFYNAALWVLWSQLGWKLSDHFQFFLVPVGLSTILFAAGQPPRSEPLDGQHDPFGRPDDHVCRHSPCRSGNSRASAPGLVLLVGSLVGIFLGIGMRLQTFLWMGLATFVLDVVYEMGESASTSRSPSGPSCSVSGSRWCSSSLSMRRRGSSPRCAVIMTRPGSGNEAFA